MVGTYVWASYPSKVHVVGEHDPFSGQLIRCSIFSFSYLVANRYAARLSFLSLCIVVTIPLQPQMDGRVIRVLPLRYQALRTPLGTLCLSAASVGETIFTWLPRMQSASDEIQRVSQSSRI